MPARKIFTDEQFAEMIRLYSDTSASTRDIARIYGVATNTINKNLKAAGIELSAGKKISSKMVGKPSAAKGAIRSAETRKKISEASKGRKTTLGKKYTPEERARLSAGQKAYYAANPRPKKEKVKRPPTVMERVRSRCKQLLRRVLEVTGKKKVTRTYDTLGYTEKELKLHIESQFREGMSWDNRESFHIDHIIPLSWFVKNGIDEPKIINALTNLQPLFPHENRAKSDKTHYEVGLI